MMAKLIRDEEYYSVTKYVKSEKGKPVWGVEKTFYNYGPDIFSKILLDSCGTNHDAVQAECFRLRKSVESGPYMLSHNEYALPSFRVVRLA